MPRMVSVTSSPGNTSPAPYERFKAWHACHELALAVYAASRSWPKEELYGLTSRARRGVFSAASNLAEGAAKRGSAEFRRFLDIAVGSIAELTYVLRLLKDLGYLSPKQWGELEALRDHAGRLTWGLYRSVSRRGGKAVRR